MTEHKPPTGIVVELGAARHARDWLSRYDGTDARALAVRPRSVVLDLGPSALRDLVTDAIYYSEEMHPTNTGDYDYRPAARACLRALHRAGVTWTRRPGTFAVTVDIGRPLG